MQKYSEIGHRIRSVRGETSQRVFAESLDLSLMGYQNYESGRRMPPGSVLAKISELFGVTVDWLLTGKGLMYVNYVAESGTAYAMDDTTQKVVEMMKDMDKKGRLDVLQYLEAKELWRAKKLKEG